MVELQKKWRVKYLEIGYIITPDLIAKLEDLDERFPENELTLDFSKESLCFHYTELETEEEAKDRILCEKENIEKAKALIPKRLEVLEREIIKLKELLSK